MSEPHPNSHLWPGVPLALASAVLFGATPPLSKLLLNAVSPFVLAGLLYLGAGLGLTIYRFFQGTIGNTGNQAPLRQQDVPWLALAIGTGGVLAPVLLMFGLSRTSASSTALLLNVEGLATMAIAWLVFHENVDRRLLLGAFAILAGAVLLSWEGQGVAFNPGAMLVVGACVAWGIDNNLTRKISATDPTIVAMLKGLVAGSVNVVLALLTGAALPSTGNNRGGGRGGLTRRRCQPCHVHLCSAAPWHRAHRRVLFARPFHRGDSRNRLARRPANAQAGARRCSDGDWAVAASGRTP
jgi:drug/metabolite transporter (DMT)-like permease